MHNLHRRRSGKSSQYLAAACSMGSMAATIKKLVRRLNGTAPTGEPRNAFGGAGCSDWLGWPHLRRVSPMVSVNNAGEPRKVAETMRA